MPPFLLHEIFPSGDVVLMLMLMVLGIGIVFAFIGVAIARRYGPAGLAMSTVGFCLLLFIVTTSSDRDLGAVSAFPIMGGFAQAGVIGIRTRNGGGRSTAVEAAIGGAVFIAGMIAAAIVGAILLS
jgi:hypothetical protein